MDSELRIGGTMYKVIWTRERQIINGVEHLIVVDHDTRQIRLSHPLRHLLAAAVGGARRTVPTHPIVTDPLPAPPPVPPILSDCLAVRTIPWPQDDH